MPKTLAAKFTSASEPALAKGPQLILTRRIYQQVA